MTKILQAPYIDQTANWVYGCESVSAAMLLQYLGLPVGPDEFIDRYLPRAQSSKKGGIMVAENPAYYYINNPRDTTGWGCYAPCIQTALCSAFAAYGKADAYEVTDETGKTAEELCREYIDHDMPVVFWATLDFEPSIGEDHWVLPDGRDFAWKNHEHCLLLVGYDENNYWFNDPWHNHGCCPYPKALVEQRHCEQDSYAVSLRKKD
jgi:uncharacterized protein YvpB